MFENMLENHTALFGSGAFVMLFVCLVFPQYVAWISVNIWEFLRWAKLKLKGARKTAPLILVGLMLFAGTAWAGKLVTPTTVFSWGNPTLNTDGTPLIDGAGAKFYCGSDSRLYTMVMDVGNVSMSPILDIVVGSLPAGYVGFVYCTNTYYDVYGNESAYDGEVRLWTDGVNFTFADTTVTPNPPTGLKVEEAGP